MFIKKSLFFSFLLSPSLLMGMDHPGLALVRNRNTYTIEAQQRIFQQISENLDNFTKGKIEHAYLSEAVLNLNSNEVMALITEVTDVNKYQDLFLNIQAIMFAHVAQMDQDSYNALCSFMNDINTYFNRFLICRSDEDITTLLKDIERSKDEITEKFHQCSYIVIKLAGICTKAAVSYCLSQLPESVIPYLPTAIEAGKGLVAACQESVKELPSLHDALGMIGKGYLAKVVQTIEFTGHIKLSPGVHRAVFFVGKLAKMFFLDASIRRPLINNYAGAVVAFPVSDTYFGQKFTFEQLAREAFKGNLEVVQTFCETYPQLMKTTDSEGKNLLSMAIAGYCNGKDEAWEVIAYLLNRANLDVMQRTGDMLEAASTDVNLGKRADRDWRKQKVLDMLAAKDAYDKANGANGFYSVSFDAPQKAIVVVPAPAARQDCIIS